MAEIKTPYQCWHGTYVQNKYNKDEKKQQWYHPNSKTWCDDPNPMYKPGG